MNAPTPPPLQPLGPAVVVQGQGIIDLVYLISKGIKGAERDGYPTGRFHEHLRIFRQAYEFGVPNPVSRGGHGDTTSGSDLRQSRGDELDTIGTAEAARLSGLSRRTCQRLAKSGLGRRIGASWVLDRAGFIAHLATREDDNDRAAT